MRDMCTYFLKSNIGRRLDDGLGIMTKDSVMAGKKILNPVATLAIITQQYKSFLNSIDEAPTSGKTINFRIDSKFVMNKKGKMVERFFEVVY